jgi:hypothetical protein
MLVWQCMLGFGARRTLSRMEKQYPRGAKLPSADRDRPLRPRSRGSNRRKEVGPLEWPPPDGDYFHRTQLFAADNEIVDRILIGKEKEVSIKERGGGESALTHSRAAGATLFT